MEEAGGGAGVRCPLILSPNCALEQQWVWLSVSANHCLRGQSLVCIWEEWRKKLEFCEGHTRAVGHGSLFPLCFQAWDKHFVPPQAPTALPGIPNRGLKAMSLPHQEMDP